MAMTYDPATGTFGFDIALRELLKGKPVRRKAWVESGESLGAAPWAAYIEHRFKDENPLPWFPTQSDILATDWEMVYG